MAPSLAPRKCRCDNSEHPPSQLAPTRRNQAHTLVLGIRAQNSACHLSGRRSTLALELLLTRIFDVILYPNLAYMIITGAVFAFGLAGIYTTLRPLPAGADPSAQLARLTALMAASLLLIRPLLNIIPFRFEAIASDPLGQGIWFLAMYAVITIPFVLCGLVLARVFSAWAEAIQRLYFWDLAVPPSAAWRSSR